MNILYLIPTGLVVAAAYSFYRTYKSDKSGTLRQEQDRNSPNFGKYVAVPNEPIYQISSFRYGCAFILAAMIIFFVIHSDYRGPKAKDQERWEKQKEREQR